MANGCLLKLNESWSSEMLVHNIIFCQIEAAPTCVLAQIACEFPVKRGDRFDAKLRRFPHEESVFRRALLLALQHGHEILSTRIFYLYYRVYTPYLKNNHQHKAFRSQSERDWANPTTLSPGSRTDQQQVQGADLCRRRIPTA